MIIWMWVPLSVSQSQGECNEVWVEGAPCSPDAARPIMITMGKENNELLAKIVPPVDVEIGELQQNGVTVEDNGKMYTLKVEFHRSMNDGKMQKLLLGRGGGFCVLCPFSADEAVSPDQIKDGFEIGNVDIATLNALYENLADDDKGVKKHQGDYKDRMGLTQNPISAYNVATFPILHALQRGLDYCLKVAYKLNAGFTSWKEDQKQKAKKKEAKKRIIAMIKAKTGIAVDMPDAVGAGGTSTTGNTARALLFDPEKRQVLIECIPQKVRRDQECDRVVYDEFITNLSIILRVVSSKQRINTEHLDHLCNKTELKLVSHWPGFKFTPSVHQVLAHSAALISANDSKGLGTLSEEPLEHNNKNLRIYREHLARKTTQHANLSDVITRLWIKSDPIVRSFQHAVKCSFCGEEHNVWSCTQKHARSSCFSLEEHLLACMFADDQDQDQETGT